MRKGHDADGAQRWLCRGCGRTFSRKTMGLLSMSRLDVSQWERFCELAARHAPLAECARECDVSAPTAHFMRVRLCQVMEAATPAFRGGNAQVDATYLNESMSGLGRRGGAEMPRERGISNNKVCVVCGVGGDGDCFAEACDRGRPTDDAVRSALSGRVGEGDEVATDDHQAYRRVLPDLRVAAHVVFPADGSAGDGLGAVNSLHRRLDDFLRPFNGVSTRWLPWYLAWFRWEEQLRRSGADRAQALVGIAANGTYRLTRRRLQSAPRPFWGYWEGAAKAA